MARACQTFIIISWQIGYGIYSIKMPQAVKFMTCHLLDPSSDRLTALKASIKAPL